MDAARVMLLSSDTDHREESDRERETVFVTVSKLKVADSVFCDDWVETSDTVAPDVPLAVSLDSAEVVVDAEIAAVRVLLKGVVVMHADTVRTALTVLLLVDVLVIALLCEPKSVALDCIDALAVAA